MVKKSLTVNWLEQVFQGLYGHDLESYGFEPLSCQIWVCSSLLLSQSYLNQIHICATVRGYFMVMSGDWDLVDSSWGLAKKHTSERSKRVCFFAKTSMRVHQILIPTNYLEVTHFSHEKFSIFPVIALHIAFCLACVHVLIACQSRASRHVRVIHAQ